MYLFLQAELVGFLKLQLYGLVLFYVVQFAVCLWKILIVFHPVISRYTSLTGFLILCFSCHSGAIQTGTFCSLSIGFPRIRSDARSATMMVGAFKFPFGMVGKTEESTTRRLSMPRTRHSSSSTAIGSSSAPI